MLVSYSKSMDCLTRAPPTARNAIRLLSSNEGSISCCRTFSLFSVRWALSAGLIIPTSTTHPSTSSSFSQPPTDSQKRVLMNVP